MKRFSLNLLLLSAVSACNVIGPAELRLDVMSFNIRYANQHDGGNRWDVRKDIVYDMIRKQDPDVIGLQEALRGQLNDMAEALPGYTEVGEGRDGGDAGEYSAIFYRTARFTLAESGTFWLSDNPEKPSIHWGNACVRICTWARLTDRDSGKSFYLYNTHLDHVSQLSRENSAELIMKRIAGRSHQDPFILTGDLNAGEDNPAITILTENGLKDTFRVLHPGADNAGTFNSWKGRAEGEKIDYIFVSSTVKTLDASIVRFNVDGRYPSDHFPVTAKVQIR